MLQYRCTNVCTQGDSAHLNWSPARKALRRDLSILPRCIIAAAMSPDYICNQHDQLSLLQAGISLPRQIQIADVTQPGSFRLRKTLSFANWLAWAAASCYELRPCWGPGRGLHSAMSCPLAGSSTISALFPLALSAVFPGRGAGGIPDLLEFCGVRQSQAGASTFSVSRFRACRGHLWHVVVH